MAEGLLVEQITPLCQLQDLGRRGWQSQGVTRSGAMDARLLQIANALVGNAAGSPCLEFALAGGQFTVTAASLRLAFAGDFELQHNGMARDSYCSVRLSRGDSLTVGAARSGVRGYLAVAGGFACAPQLGSCATHLRSGLGGFPTGIANGTELPCVLQSAPWAYERSLRPGLRPQQNNTVRVVAGPQTEHFSEAGVQTFFSSSYTVCADSDRMGIRLEGETIEHIGDGNIISDPVLPGSVQVPASGQPIVLMADGPTTGGYPKIATTATVDLSVLAQLAAGDQLRFEAIDLEQAQQLLLEQRTFLNRLEQVVDKF